LDLAAARGGKDIVLGVACGVGAATFWAGGFAAARHGIAVGLSPFDIAFHRYVWAGVLFLPEVLRHGVNNLNGIGWMRGLALVLLGGLGQAVVSAAGFLLVPLAHGGVIQPSSAALTGLLLAVLILGEKPPPIRVYGAIVIVAGIVVIGGEGAASIGGHGLLGDFTFALAGLMFATFGILLRMWRINPTRATAVISTLTLLYVPIHAAVFGFDRMIAAGWLENALQAVVQGVFSGPMAIYLFARSVMLLGASRAAVFPSLVPGLTLFVGFVALGEVPSVLQLAGLAIVLAGFRLTQKA
jgi:drug/metabolite transporter (DMT)-like permease